MMRYVPALLLVPGLLIGAGCSSASAPNPAISLPKTATPSTNGTPTITSKKVVASGLTTPWGVAFLPDGSALVTERDTGVINRVTPRPGALAAVAEVGQVPSYHEDEGGLLGIAVQPGAQPSRAFVYYTTEGDNRIGVMSWDGRRLGSPRPILSGIPAAAIHNGGRLAFGPDGYLYVGTGEAGEPANSQDLNSLGGKILRITTSGKGAPGNPFGASPVWSLGHRNVQGLAFDSKGQLWNSEFGEHLHDELNKVTKGSNYGWPIHEGIAHDPKYADPYVQWPTTEASPSGLAIIDNWAYMAALRGKQLWQIGIAGPRPVGPNGLLVGEFGRLRTPTVAPDGTLWLTTSNTDGRANPRAGDDKILQLTLSR